MEIDAGAGIDRWMDFLRFLEIDQLLNLAEAILWLSISGIFAFRLRRTKTNRDLSITCIIAFALFGISDFIEVGTRAWYRPASLFVLKAGCVSAFVSAFVLFHRRRRRSHPTTSPQGGPA
jgi:hypothetical protein